MKNFIVFITACFALSLLGCQDTKEDLKTALPDHSHYKSVGEQIPLEVGLRWMDTYERKNNTMGREASPYSITPSQLDAVLESVPDLIGVAFHHATDALGNPHILVIPVGESLNLWSSLLSQKVIIDANSGARISETVAQLWTLNYKLAHPNDIWFHFFGSDIFDEINTIPYFNALDIEPAINDADQSPQMLLIVWNVSSSINGRTMDEAMVYDASNPCPPCPVGGGGSE